MMYNIIYTDFFAAELKHYKRKYKSVTKDIRGLLEELASGNLVGDEIPNLRISNGESVFKVRVANSSANKGKSGGFRVIYYVVRDEKDIFLLSMYSKTDRENIDSTTIITLIKKYCMNLE